MKQKNLILMVVAVGCGLVAAFLTTQMNARAEVEQVEVIVAAKDLPVGTMMTKDDLPKLIDAQEDRQGRPAAGVRDDRGGVGRQALTRAVRKDETFNPQRPDQGRRRSPSRRDGHGAPCRSSVPSAVAGFVVPGLQGGRARHAAAQQQAEAFPLLVDMLVLAVDQHVSTDTTKNGSGVFPNMSTCRSRRHRNRPCCWPWPSTAGATWSCSAPPGQADRRGLRHQEGQEAARGREAARARAEASTDGNDGSDGPVWPRHASPRPRRPPRRPRWSRCGWRRSTSRRARRSPRT